MSYGPQGSALPSHLVHTADSHALQSPEAPAAHSHFGTRILTYRELSARSRNLAARLRSEGVCPGDAVAVCLPASPDSLVAILAIFRIGGVYVPMRPDHPKKYLENMMFQAQPRMIITVPSVLPESLAHGTNLIFLSPVEPHGLASEETFSLPVGGKDEDQVERDPHDPAALLFTSGSTGTPKGVLLTGDNLAHLVESATAVIIVSRKDVFCNIAKPTFSISFFDLLVPLSIGASVRFLDSESFLNFDALVRELRQSTVLHAGPAFLTTLYRHITASQGSNLATQPFHNLRHVSTGGDIVLPVVRQRMRTLFPSAELFVFYGCTEIACMGTFFQFAKLHDSDLTEGTGALVGHAFPNMEVALVDEDGRSIPTSAIGQVGEILFRGRGVSQGYLNLPELTAQVFGEGPSFPENAQSGQNRPREQTKRNPYHRSYRTGDFGRWQPEGALEILGRRDFQVQIRGIRVELTALENRLVELGIALQSAVLQRPDPKGEETILVAFVVPRDQTPLKTEDILEALGQEFPKEMLPSRFHFLEALPLNPNGKLDRKALATLELPDSLCPQESAPGLQKPMTPTETKIAEIFARELGLTSIGAHDNFFVRGGYSLLAVLTLGSLEREQGIRISIADFFRHPTVAGMASLWERKALAEAPQTTPCRAFPLGPLDKTKPPLFLLAGGNIYKNLADSLSTEWSVFGVVSDKEVLHIDPDGQPRRFSVEELAEDYYEALVTEHPQGPYTILGHSFGGVVAYHLATLLKSRGHSVNELLMVDALLPEWALRKRFRLMQFLRLFSSPPQDVFRFFWSRIVAPQGTRTPSALSAAPRPASAPWDPSDPSEPASTRSPQDAKAPTQPQGNISQLDATRVDTKRQAAVAYIKRMPREFPHATLFLSLPRRRANPLHGRFLTWERYIRRLRVVWVDADHSAMIKEPQAIAKIQKELLLARDRLLGATSGAVANTQTDKALRKDS